MTFFFVRSCRLLIESDLQPGAFDDAVSGVDVIAHTASTVSFAAADPSGEFTGPLVMVDVR